MKDVVHIKLEWAMVTQYKTNHQLLTLSRVHSVTHFILIEIHTWFIEQIM